MTWNVQGPTDLKILELILHMLEYQIDVLCLQETWISRTQVRDENDFLVTLSGSGGIGCSWAGVGFMVATWCRRRVKCYKQVSDRMAPLKMKVSGGTVGIVTAHASHNTNPLADRLNFICSSMRFTGIALRTKAVYFWRLECTDREEPAGKGTLLWPIYVRKGSCPSSRSPESRLAR